MVIGFKCDIGGCVFGFCVCYLQCMDFGVWFFGVMVIIFVDDVVIVNNDIVDIRVWVSGEMFMLCQFECLCYVKFILYGLVLQVSDFFVKVFDIFEIVIDGGKVNICDFIEFFQLFYDQVVNYFVGNFMFFSGM